MKNSSLRWSAAFLAIGLALAATPALADGKHKHGNDYWYDNGHHYGHYKKHPPEVVRYYDDGPDVIYVERPVYVRERVYVEPPRIYREPARPQINIVVPLFD
ncbi:hypothetical protein [Dongia rigui]|uniref:Uncharacterized protein n=1 Tax=Dongia rigui TaxID=940149 RepID=A0ABU5DYL0_9PROT|nr:hypothetical protein [Dongia rigui]MDY0872364.1 hypothetical protein [Dongia rigui]